MDRRKFLASLSVGSLGLMGLPNAWAEDSNTPVLFPVPTNTGISGRVVVVGGGMSGAAVAKYLRLWGGTGVAVTLVEASPSYTSNIMSNTVLTGQRTLASLNYTYDTLVSHYGVTRVNAKVSGINRAAKYVTLESGGTISYDRLVLAPGLDFDLMPGMSSLAEYETLVPHAWKAGPQTQLLRNQLLAMPAGQNVVLTIPKAPYRCPPGPYERVCVIADWLKQNKAGSRIIVLDANADIIVEKENFSHAFTTLYAGVVDYRPGCNVTHVDSASRVVTYDQVINWDSGGDPGAGPGRGAQSDPAATGTATAEGRRPAQCRSREAVRPGQRAELPVDRRSARPRHRRRQPDDAAEGRAHRQPAGQDLRGCHPAPVERSAHEHAGGHQLRLLHADHGDHGHLAVGHVPVRSGDRDDGDPAPAQQRQGDRRELCDVRQLPGHAALVHDADGRDLQLTGRLMRSRRVPRRPGGALP